MRTYKVLLLLITLYLLSPLTAISLAEPRHAAPGPEFTTLIPGTDKPLVISCSKGTIYKFNEYLVYTVPSKTEAGENIYVYPASLAGSDNKTTCTAMKHRPIYSYKNDVLGGAYFFVGLYGDYLFIDQGTGPAYRGLSIYNLDSGKLQFHTNYTSPSLSNGTLSYFETIYYKEFYDAKNTCSMKQPWKLEGLNTLFQKEMSYNLETGEKKATDNYRCIPGQ